MIRLLIGKLKSENVRAKKEYIPIIAGLLNTDKDELLTLWLADQVTAIVADAKGIATKVLNIAKENVEISFKENMNLNFQVIGT